MTIDGWTNVAYWLMWLWLGLGLAFFTGGLIAMLHNRMDQRKKVGK